MPGPNGPENKVARNLQTVLNAPLPELVERLGLSVAHAQAALDRNSLELAKEMAAAQVEIGDKTYNLLSLGFQPAFYAFTEATIEAKMAFTIAESSGFGIGGSLGASFPAGPVMIGATINVQYSRKYSFEVRGSSSVAARLVSLPPPARFAEVLSSFANAQPNRGNGD